MKRIVLSALVVTGLTVLAGAQTVTAPKSNWLADSITREGDLSRFHGHVRIAACSVITADDATWSGNDVEVSGNVHITLTNGVDPLP